MSPRRLGALAAVLSLGCGGAPPAQTASSPAVHRTRQALCDEARTRGSSLLVLASSDEIASLESAAKRSIAVVRFDGCELDVMPACQGLGAYRDGPPLDAADTRTLTTSAGLFEAASIGAAPLYDEFERGAALEVALVPAGTRIANKPPAMATGDCDGATHWVKTIRVGTFTVGLKPAGGAPAKELARRGAAGPYAVELEPMRGR